MNCLPLACIVFVICAFPVSAQTMETEIGLIREQLGVSESTPITLANSPDLPTADPLKVYIAAGFDMEVRKRTSERIDEWNKKDAQKYGALTLVSELSQADVVLVQYSDKEHPISKVHSNTSTKAINTTVFIPGNSYIVAPKGNGYEVLWRYQGKAIEHGRGVAGQTMRDHFFDMLKHRKRG